MLAATSRHAAVWQIRQLIALAKAQPDKLVYGTGGPGSSQTAASSARRASRPNEQRSIDLGQSTGRWRCDHARMATPKIRTLQPAAQTLGGERALADALGVKPEDVARWLTGVTPPHDRAYLAALDIVARGPLNTTRKK